MRSKPKTPDTSLQRFTLLFYVGRDDVHGVLQYLLSRAQTSLYLNMFGYDDVARSSRSSGPTST